MILMKLSVVIPSIDLNMLRECIGYLYANAGYPIDELIIVADKPDVMMYNYLIHLVNDYDAVVVIHPIRVGLVRAFNVGLKIAKHELVLQLAEDMWGQPNFVKNLVDALLSNPHYGSVTSLQSNYPDVKFTQMCCLHFKHVLEELGYMDEIYSPMSWEDADYVMKQLANGYIPHGCSDSMVFHYPHQKRDYAYSIQNMKIFFDRWKVKKWDWYAFPVHASNEKCKCDIDKVVKKICGSTVKHLKKRWMEIGNRKGNRST